ncbi:MAG: AraC family transcriptional regulator ligand-binding domain-containing protein [Rhizobiaceae bacterium]
MISGEPYIRAVNLIGLEELLAEHGCDAHSMMAEVGLPPSALGELDRLVSFRRVAALWEIATLRHNIEHFGLLTSKNCHPDYVQLGPTIWMASFVRTLGEWVETAMRYWRFHTNGFFLQLIEPEGDETILLRVHFDALSLPARQVTEATIANIVGVCRVIANRPDENPIEVRFQHSKPSDTSMHTELFRCPVKFGCDHVEIVAPRQILSYATNGSLRVLKPLMRLYVSERIRRMRLVDHSFASTVALTITSILGAGACNVESVSKSLDVNPKTLQRQLAKEGTSFSDIMEKVRESMARHLLVETDASVGSVAGLLD